MRAAAPLRELGRWVTTGALACVLLLSAVASHSDVLHEWLHKNHHAPTHYCLITALEQGHSEVPTLSVVVQPAWADTPLPAAEYLSSWSSRDLSLHAGRDPPSFC